MGSQNESYVEVFLGVINAMDTNINSGLRGGDHLVIALDLYRDEGELGKRALAMGHGFGRISSAMAMPDSPATE
jgi:hypothetical protein